jgi:histidinol-phosphate aminotransferase
MKAKKTIQELTPYPVPLFEEEGFLKLDSNENDFGPSPKVIEALSQVTQADIQYYPYYGELLQKLADFHGVDIDNVILTAGADEAISSVFGAFLDYGQTVLTVSPSFVMPKIYAKVNGLNYKEISYRKKWEFPTEEFIESIDEDIDLVHLTTPNSPTGEVISQEVIQFIVDKSAEKAILIDETYGNYSKLSSLGLIKTYDNIFVVRSFSKDFALAGLRLGYVVSDSKNIKHLRKYLSPYNVSTLTVKAGIAALEDAEHFEKVRLEIEKSKKVLAEGLENLGAKIYPSTTNFICVDFGSKADFVYQKLLSSKIKVRYFNQAPLLENTMRIAVPKMENTLKVLAALKVRPTIVFDMDGVLIDASKSYRVAVQETFKHFSGKEVCAKEISAVKKLGGLNNDWDLTEFLLKKESLDIPKDDIVEVFQSYYEKLADVEEMLVGESFFENLSEKYNLAIFTGRLKKEAHYALDKNGFTKYFYPIITLDDVGLDRQKPHPLGIEMIKEQIITEEIYYLGDTVDDMVCSYSSNVIGIGVLPPQDKSDELKELLKSKNAAVVLNQTKDLEEFLSQGD